MKRIKDLIHWVQNIPVETQRAIHGWATCVWFVAAFPIMAVPTFRNSVPLLVFMSAYAIVAAHWGAWQGVRAEQEAQT